MESVNSDFKELFLVLETHKVRYLLVGGYAVMHYTEPRYTKRSLACITASKSGSSLGVRSSCLAQVARFRDI